MIWTHSGSQISELWFVSGPPRHESGSYYGTLLVYFPVFVVWICLDPHGTTKGPTMEQFSWIFRVSWVRICLDPHKTNSVLLWTYGKCSYASDGYIEMNLGHCGKKIVDNFLFFRGGKCGGRCLTPPMHKLSTDREIVELGFVHRNECLPVL